jgi:ketosteroid isomerase-like protein
VNVTQFLCVVLMAAAPAAFGDASASNTLAETQIRSALGDWVSAANRGDYRAALKVWAPDLIGWAPDGVDDTYQREAAFAGLPVQAPKTTYKLIINEVIVDGSLAVVRDTWIETTLRDAGPATVSQFRSYEVWRRQPDKTWKISRWIDGPVLPTKE